MSLFEGMTAFDILKDTIGSNEYSRFFNWTAAGFKVMIGHITDPMLSVHKVTLYVRRNENGALIECMTWSIGMERLKGLKTDEIIKCGHIVLDRFVRCLETKFPVDTNPILEVKEEDAIKEHFGDNRISAPTWDRESIEEFGSGPSWNDIFNGQFKVKEE